MSEENFTKQQLEVRLAENKLKIIISIRVMWLSLALLIVIIGTLISQDAVNKGMYEFLGIESAVMFIIRMLLAMATGYFGERIIELVGDTANLHKEQLELASNPDSK